MDIESTKLKQESRYTVAELKEKNVSHLIGNLVHGDKNVEIRAIILEKLEDYKLKDRSVAKFLIADLSGSIHANFFGE